MESLHNPSAAMSTQALPPPTGIPRSLDGFQPLQTASSHKGHEGSDMSCALYRDENLNTPPSEVIAPAA